MKSGTIFSLIPNFVSCFPSTSSTYVESSRLRAANLIDLRLLRFMSFTVSWIRPYINRKGQRKLALRFVQSVSCPIIEDVIKCRPESRSRKLRMGAEYGNREGQYIQRLHRSPGAKYNVHEHLSFLIFWNFGRGHYIKNGR